MSQDAKGQFYEPNTKIISNPEDAHEIGNMMNAAVDREAQLKVKRETGLTELQQNNVNTIKSIHLKYPDALEEHVSLGGDTFYTFTKEKKSLEKVNERLASNVPLVNVLLSKDGVAVSDARYAGFEFTETGKATEDLKSLHEKLETNHNTGDESTYLNCKKDIETLDGQWKTVFSANLKAFDSANRDLKDSPQDKKLAATSFIDSL